MDVFIRGPHLWPNCSFTHRHQLGITWPWDVARSFLLLGPLHVEADTFLSVIRHSHPSKTKGRSYKIMMFPQPAFEFIFFDSRAGFLWIHHWLPLGALVFLGSWCLRLLPAGKPTRSQSHPGHHRPRWDFWDKQSTFFWLKLCTRQTTSENLMSQEKIVWDMRKPYRSNIVTF